MKERGYSVFGVQFYGECWSGPRAACDYNTFGNSENCVDEKLGACQDKNSLLCSGKNTEDMYVYIPADTPGGLTCPTTIPTTPTTMKITTPTTNKITGPTPTPIGPPTIRCENVEYKLTKLGCWKEFGINTPSKAIPELLLTSRDKSSSVYVGYSFTENNFPQYIRR